jgi:transposase
VDILEESTTKENVRMTQKSRRTFTDEQKAEAVRIVGQSGKPVSQVAQEMGLTESALCKWVKQARIDRSSDTEGSLTSAERQELNKLRRDLKRVRRSRAFLKKRPSYLGTPQSTRNTLTAPFMLLTTRRVADSFLEA